MENIKRKCVEKGAKKPHPNKPDEKKKFSQA